MPEGKEEDGEYGTESIGNIGIPHQNSDSDKTKANM